MDGGNATNNCASLTVVKGKTLVALYAVFAAVAFLSQAAAIFILVKTKAYKVPLYRLTLYQSVAGTLRTISYVVQVLPVDIGLPAESPVVLRSGWGGVCLLGVFMTLYAPFVQSSAALWISGTILSEAVRPGRGREVSRLCQAAGLLCIFAVPLPFSAWVPITAAVMYSNFSGVTGVRCGVWTSDCSTYAERPRLLELMVSSIATNLLVTVIGLALILAAIGVVVRKGRTAADFRRHYLSAIKERILPSGLYPVVFMLVLIARLVSILAGEYSNTTSVVFMVVTQSSFILLPISLLMAPNVTPLSCSAKIKRKNVTALVEERFELSQSYTKFTS